MNTYVYERIAEFVSQTRNNINSLVDVKDELKSTVSGIGDGGEVMSGDGLAITNQEVFKKIDQNIVSIGNYLEKLAKLASQYGESVQRYDTEQSKKQASNVQ